ncbi:MAG: hypothetical protein Kow0063_18730 [Anaerolineae bacterium]
METEETAHAGPESRQPLEIPWFVIERGTEEASFRHFYVSPRDVLIDDELPPPDFEGRCESNCACT